MATCGGGITTQPVLLIGRATHPLHPRRGQKTLYVQSSRSLALLLPTPSLETIALQEWTKDVVTQRARTAAVPQVSHSTAFALTPSLPPSLFLLWYAWMQVLYEIAPRGFTSPNGAGVEGAGSGNASVSVIILFVKRLEDGARVLKLIRWPPDLSKLPFPPRAFAPTIYTFFIYGAVNF